MSFYSDILELIQSFDYNNDTFDFKSNSSFMHLTDVLCINRISYQIIGNNGSEVSKTIYSNITFELGENYDSSLLSLDNKTIILRVYRYQYAAEFGELEDLFNIFTTIILNKITAVENAKASNSILYRDQQLNVYNLNYLYRHINTLIKSKKISEYSIAFINIIQCRNINMLFGSDATTVFLKAYSEKINSVIDESKDEILTRLGGDNFIIIFRNENTDKIVNTIKEINIRIDYNNDIIEYALFTRMGIARLSNDCKNIEAVMNPAASAIAMARLPEYPDIYFYQNENKKSNMEEEDIAVDIRKALDEEKFFVYFQPIVSKNNDEIKLFSAEALIRWRRNGEMINPRSFLSIADKYNLMCDIDLYVLRTVCSRLASWIKDGLNPVCIHCNFADSDLLTPNLPERILEIIDEYGIHHSLINIEFTESAYHNNKSAFSYTVSKLYNNGVKISIDNFGKNFTSLELFEKLDFTTLKIDSSIVNSDNSRTRIILGNLIALADNLGIEVICEGADTKNEVERAFEAGCDIFQSEVYDKALSERYFTSRLKKPVY